MKYSLCVFCVLLGACIPTQRHVAAEGVEYVGFYSENFQESLFFPCGVKLAEDGWWLRFREGVKADRARYQYEGAGFPNSSHDIRVRGTLSKPGRYGTGFHTRELVVHELLEVKNPGGICAGYQAKPARWNGAGAVGGRVIAATVSDDRSLAAIVDVRGEVTIWRTASGDLIKRFPGEDASLQAIGIVRMAFSHSADLLAIGGADGYVRIWGVPDGELRRKLRQSAGADTIGPPTGAWLIRGNSAPVASVAFTPDGKILVATGGSRAFTWSVSSGRVIDTLAGAEGNRYLAPAQAVVARNPTRIITTGESATLQVYSLHDRRPLLAVAAPLARGGLMKLSPDNRWIAIMAGQDSVLLWSLAEGRFTQTFSVPHFFGGGLAFSPDGNTIAVAGGQFALYLWDTNTGQPLRSIHGLTHWARDIWFNARGDSIVVSSVMDSTLSVIPLNRRGQL